jgi:cell wall-associated NlpC family hydrolase
MYAELLNIPYKHASIDPKVGLDCLTFIYYFYEKVLGLRITAPIPQYPEDWQESKHTLYFDAVRPYCTLIPFRPHALAQNDIVFLTRRGYIEHAGIYLGGGKFIHCSEGYGVKIHKLDYFATKVAYIAKVHAEYLEQLSS